MGRPDKPAPYLSAANAAGLLVAASAVPESFQRTLTTRSTADQALVTGLTFVLSQSLVSSLESGLQAVARSVLPPTDDEADEAARALLADLAGVLAGGAVMAAVPRLDDERLPRATVRTSGRMVAVSGLAGVLARLAREAGARGGLPGGPRAALTATAAAATVVRQLDLRARAALDEGLDLVDADVQVGRTIAMAAGVSTATAVTARAESVAAQAVGRTVARVLPGGEDVWRPLGHAAVFGTVAAAGRAAVQRVFRAIEGTQTGFEAALDVAPPVSELSGSPTSHIPYDTLSRMGRRLMWTVRPPREIEHVMGEPAVAHPVRAYGGLELADEAADRVRIVLDDLERAGGLDRSWLLVASPTGTGYVNYAAVGALELLTRGDCATVALQYAARPSPLSLDRVEDGREQFRLLVDALGERLAGREHRPRVVVFGESLGAWTSQDAFLHLGTDGLDEAGIDLALWIGTPFESEWKDQVLDDDRDDVDPSSIGVFNDIGEWEALDPAVRDRIRFVMLTHHDDGVALFGASLLVRQPDWLGPPDTRPVGVPRSQRWAPLSTFVQTLVDMKNAARVVPGVFEAKGHDYRADLPGFIAALLRLPATDEQLARVTRALEAEEAVRTRWLREHARVGEGMANDLLQRIRRDHPAAFEAAFDDLRAEVRGWRDDWDDEGSGPA